MMHCKEEFLVLENLAKEQERVFTDALDVGVPYNPDTTARIKFAMDNSVEYGCVESEARDVGNLRTITLFFMTEVNDYDRSKVDGLRVVVTLNVTHCNMNFRHSFEGKTTQHAFYTIDITRGTVANNFSD
jgi:hypothetical protein